MITPEEILVSPTTGERVVLLGTSEETDGGRMTIELRAAPGALSIPEQIGAHHTQVLEVLEGTLGARVDGEEIVARAGDMVVADTGGGRRWWNPGPGELVVRVHVRPALDVEQLRRALVVSTPYAGSNGAAPAAA